jgi:putative inorganic carbon (hco3(-)) transporter
MRDVIVLTIILASVPICFFRPYFGVLMWAWVAYFNPHRFTFGPAYDFPVSTVIAIPTLLGIPFTRQLNRKIFVRETWLLLLFWAWVTITYLHALRVPIFADHLDEARVELMTVSKILLMTCVTILLVNSKKKLEYLFVVIALSFGALAVKGAIFGIRTSGDFRVWGPPDSFVADNNDLGLALTMSLPIMFYMARETSSRWLRRILWLSFLCSVLAVILTYSRGALLGLAVVLGVLTIKSKQKILAGAFLVVFAFFVLAFAPPKWTDRMSNFLHGNIDESAEGRLHAWNFAWELASRYPVTGGGFETFTPALEERFTPQFNFAGPHSIYFQALGEQGFVGLGIFLFLLIGCFFSLWRLQRQVRGQPSLAWIGNYSRMLQIGLLGYMVSGAFLPRTYFDLWFEFVAGTALLKILYRRERAQQVVEHVPATEVRELETVSVG